MASARLLVLGLLAALAGCGAPPPEGEAPESDTSDATEAATAPSWLLSPVAQGTWVDEKASSGDPRNVTVRGWVDARVANVRFHKRVMAEVAAPYEGGATMRTLHPLSYEGPADNNNERWGAETIEIYPQGGPDGARLAGPVRYRLRFQHDLDGDGRDEVVTSRWVTLYVPEGGPADAPTPSSPWAPSLRSPARGAEQPSAPQVFFSPFDDAGAAVVSEIDAVIAAKQADPAGRHTIHAAVFNINDPRIVDRLIEAHRQGVEVRLLNDARKLRPQATWQTGDDALLRAGVPLMGVARPGNGALHVKMAIFDGRRVATGSFNWETGSSTENHENMLLSDDPALVAAYAARFEALAGGPLLARQGLTDPAASAWLGFAPDEAPHVRLGQILDQAQASIRLAMFTAKDVVYTENGQQTSLFQKLIAAKKRGVDVTLITDFGISEAAEYFGVVSDDDQNDEWLEGEGIHVVRADNLFGRYASMHHKFMVVDDELLVTGAYNWYHDAAYLNDEDVLVLRDRSLAARYTGEFVDLLHRYDPAFDPAAWPQVKLTFELKHASTQPGDEVVVVGELPQFGSWSPGSGLPLSGAAWPLWRGSLSLPIGLRAAYKFVTIQPNGTRRWEGGNDRLLTVPTEGSEATISAEFR